MIVEKNKLKIAAVIAIVAIIFSIGVVIFYKTKFANYVSTKATIVDVFKEYSVGCNINSPSLWVMYSYDVNGTTYTAKKRVFTLIGKDIGDTAYIRYDPNNPERIEDTYSPKLGVGLTLFSAIFLIMLVLSYEKKSD